MNSTAAAVFKRIRVHGRGWIFTPRDFLDLGTRSAIGLALWRLTREETTRRLARGLYDYPRIHERLGILAPNPDDVAAALAAKTGSRVQVSGQRAANLLGLSQQVPAQLVYLTDGPPRKVKIGSQVITLKPARPSKFPGVGTPAGLAVQAILAMGPNADKDFIVRQLRNTLSEHERGQLLKLAKYAPAWSHRIIEMIEKSEDGYVGKRQRDRSKGIVQRDGHRKGNLTRNC